MKKLLLSVMLVSGLSTLAQTHWVEKSSGFPTASTTQGQIHYVDANTVWAYARPGDGSGDNYQIWGRSLDSGNTWTNGAINIGNPELGIGSISGVSPTTAYISVFPDPTGTTQGGIWVTTNAGVTWTKQPSASFSTGIDSFANIVHFWDANNGWCQGDPAGGYFEMYTTTNGGANWVRVPQANIPPHLTGEYGYTGQFEVLGDIVWFSTNKGRIYRSDNRGLNWVWAAQTPLADFGGEAQSGNFAMKSSTEGILISSDWQFFRTTDGGQTWNSEFPTGYYRNFDIAHVPGTENVYVSTGVDIDEIGRGSSYSVDNGATWTDINDIDPDAVDGGGSLEFYDCTHGLASGFTTSSTVGGIWYNLFDYCSLASKDFTAQGFTATPNPTSGALEISGANIANVAVYDILGKEVINSNFGSLNTVNINLGSLNAGVYMVKVTNAAGAASTTKVVKQ